ncbi:hypothetical protein N308_13113 [Struthio camelus australis]|uniref:Uncharacterized protein n=1 Tax=Struthio camelus australis TaxID=441894 RepID=A0A093GYL0_STRCA|nr:hypothetical protein N308_13113 [Struthio camelus australis]
MKISIQIITITPGWPIIYCHALQLSISIIIIGILGCVGIWAKFQFSFSYPSHAVILYSHPIHERSEHFILNFLNASMGIKVLTQRHNCCSNDLIYIIIDNSKFAEMLYFARNLIITVKINWKRCLTYYRFDARNSETIVVICIIKPCIDHTFFRESVDLLVNQRANFTIPDCTRKSTTLQVHHF